MIKIERSFCKYCKQAICVSNCEEEIANYEQPPKKPITHLLILANRHGRGYQKGQKFYYRNHYIGVIQDIDFRYDSGTAFITVIIDEKSVSFDNIRYQRMMRGRNRRFWRYI